MSCIRGEFSPSRRRSHQATPRQPAGFGRRRSPRRPAFADQRERLWRAKSSKRSAALVRPAAGLVIWVAISRARATYCGARIRRRDNGLPSFAPQPDQIPDPPEVVEETVQKLQCASRMGLQIRHILDSSQRIPQFRPCACLGTPTGYRVGPSRRRVVVGVVMGTVLGAASHGERRTWVVVGDWFNGALRLPRQNRIGAMRSRRLCTVQEPATRTLGVRGGRQCPCRAATSPTSPHMSMMATGETVRSTATAARAARNGVQHIERHDLTETP
jgi:hypothetical protein